MATVSYIENQRLANVQLEAYEQALTELMLAPKSKVHRDRLTNETRASDLLSKMSDLSREITETYEDRDGLKKEEYDALSGKGLKDGPFTEFYERLGRIKDYHRRYPSSAPRSADVNPVEFTELEGGGIIDGRDFLDRMYTGEESLGRFLDLISLHEKYNNLPGQGSGQFKRASYLQYLDDVTGFTKIPKDKKGDAYFKYLEELLGYLQSFFKRAIPLGDFEQILQTVRLDFDNKWPEGEVDGWEKSDANASVENDGIWCSACQRSYAKQSVYDAHLTSKKHVKAAQNLQEEGSKPSTSKNNSNHANSKVEKNRRIALLEYQIQFLLSDSSSPLSSIRSDTKSNVERKQALTDRERQLEIEEQEERERREAEEAARVAENGADAGENDEDEDKEDIYNPLKLPLGWDGKPIPYWLYKLHGLGVEYKCEICNHSYMGRKNFERHFQESRHSFGMRALGLPNTKHFYEITKIEDALALAAKLKAEGQAEISRQEQIEELEDNEGNVYSRKVYEDLRKQGLLQ